MVVRRLVVAMAVAFLGAACSSGSGSNEPPDVTEPVDGVAETVPNEVIITPFETVETPDLVADLVPTDFVPDVPAGCDEDPGAPGCPCTSNEDCNTPWCVFHQGDKVCTQECLSECPTGFACEEVSGFGADSVYICKSLFPGLCLPCDHSGDCPAPGDRCVVYDGGIGSFCGGSCSADKICPDGYECVTVTTTEGDEAAQCVLETGECACTAYAVAQSIGTPCSQANEWGTCSGWRTCTADGLTICDAAAPAQEVCDNDADEDCDGVVDDADVCVICTCEGKECGDDGCGESCGECPVNHVCQLDGSCVCVPNCAGKECGDDGCGSPCGSCEPGTKCVFGECQQGCDNDDGCPALEECVDGFCQPDVPDSVQLLAPLTAETVPEAETPVLVAVVTEADLTEAAGAAPGLAAQAGFGPPGFDPATNPQEWLWADADYAGDEADGEHWQASLSTALPGTYRYTFRFTLDGSHWVYADGDGSANGLQLDQTGLWAVLAPPTIDSITPDHGTVLGGQNVTLSGAHFVSGLTLTVAGQEVAAETVTEAAITFVTPPHAAGPVSLVVTNPSGQAATATDGYRYVRRFTPTVDGETGEWDGAFLVAENTVESNWDPNLNHLDSLACAYDDQYLYLAVAGAWEANNYAVGYVDVDFGAASGVTSMLALSDNDGDGDLDDALSNILEVSVAGFGADFGWGSRGMTSFQQGDDLGNSTFVGWRLLGLPYDLAWLQGSVLCSATACEAAIPLATLYENGLPTGPQELGLLVKITDRYGDLGGISNQTLPEFFNPDNVTAVGEVAVMTLWL